MMKETEMAVGEGGGAVFQPPTSCRAGAGRGRVMECEAEEGVRMPGKEWLLRPCPSLLSFRLPVGSSRR